MSKKDHTVDDLYILSLPSTVSQNYTWVKTVVLYQAVLNSDSNFGNKESLK